MSNPALPATRSVAGYRILRLRQPLARRLIQLLPGLVAFGVALGMAIEARLGTNPWTVFHQGLAAQLGISVGVAVIVVGAVLVVSLRFLDEPFGLGTVLNVAVIGVVVDVTLWAIPEVENIAVRLLLIGLAPMVIGLASGLYIGAGLGPGPRDGLMTALSRRGLRTWQARTIVEVTALLAGWALGGDVGLGTVWMAVSVGPWVQLFLARLTIDSTE